MKSSARASLGVLLLVGLFTSFAAARAAEPTPDAIRRVEAAIATGMALQRISGLSAAVVMDNELRWSSGFGFADLENSVPFSAATVWRLGSISKSLTAVAAMQLAERGKLDLDQPIQKYCPAFPEKPRPITSRQLLGHLSGIRHYKPDENFNSTRHYRSVVESLDAFKDDPLEHEPGAAYTYSTYGYVVLGCVIEGASGRSYVEYERENVLAPAGMERTRPDDVFAIVPARARGYAKSPSGEFRNADLADTSNKVPGGGWVSTAIDLVKFAAALHTGRLLAPETFRRMQTPMRTADGKESPYFGWSIAERNGIRVLSHSGSQQGSSTYLLMIPQKGFAVALIANTERVDVKSIAERISDVLAP